MKIALILCLLCAFPSILGFPQNLTPISKFDNVPQLVFTGDDSAMANPLHLQILKTMKFGGKRRIALAAREKVYLFDPSSLQVPGSAEEGLLRPTEVYSWESDKESRDLCYMKGQPQELCYNFLSILQVKDDGDLVLCGTNAYSPLCRTLEASTENNKVILKQEGKSTSGQHICPYGPNHPSASLFTDGSLYSATFQSILGGSPIVARTMGDTYPLRTDTSSSILKEPEFIKITEDPQRVLVFFNEMDSLPTGEKRSIAQVAQVCKNDLGGDRILERMFTTFIKSRLNCSYNGFYLDQVRDVTDPITIGDQSVVFATFATPDNSLSGSAVCEFTLSNIRESLSGPFLANKQSPTSSGRSPPAATRHPGKCGDEKPTDSELIFIKSHPQMEKQVLGSLLLTNQGMRWTAIAVDVIAKRHDVTVVYLGTEDGRLIRSLPPPRGQPPTNGLVISEQDVFDEDRCSVSNSNGGVHPDERRVEKILIEKDAVLVGFKHCVVSVPLRMCSQHHCRSACIHSSDPYCGWNKTACVSYIHADSHLEESIRSSRSVSSGDPCLDETHKEEVETGNEDDEDLVIVPSPPTDSARADHDGDDELGSTLQQSDVYTIEILLIVCASTFALTLIFVLVACCLCRRCCVTSKHGKEEDEKSDSFPRSIRKTYCGLRFLFGKVTRPSQPSPRVTSDPALTSHFRRENAYTDHPVLKEHDVESAKMMRKSSSRMNSVCSASSRQDFIDGNLPSQPLMYQTSSDNSNPDSTLPKHISEQSTLPYPSKFFCDTMSSGVSSRSSGGSPPFPENGSGAAETGTLLTLSAKARRRNERAEQRASDIMRESNSTVDDLKNTLQNMQQQEQRTRLNVSPPHAIASGRYRHDSLDSGRGESCRNSLRTDLEPASCLGSRPQRPSSLNIINGKPGNRKRLHSEGSHSPEVMSVAVNHVARERRSSGNPSINSQSSGASFDQQRYSLAQPGSEPFVYDTATEKLKQRKEDKLQDYPRAVAHGTYMVQPYQQSPLADGKSIHYQLADPTHGRPSSTLNRMTSSPQKQPINYYPSVQVRGSHAQKQLHFHQGNPQQPMIKNRSSVPNYYPSLPMHGNTQPTNFAYANVGSLERPVAAGNKKKPAPTLSRHASLPPSARPVGLVTPMKNPSSTAVA